MAPPPSIEVEASRGVTFVALHGAHDLASATEVRHALGMAGTYRNLIVDVSECSFLDSTIINLLLQASRAMHLRGGLLQLVIPATAAPTIQRVFEILGVQRVLPIHESREAAIQNLGRGTAAATPTGMRLRSLSILIDDNQADAETARHAG